MTYNDYSKYEKRFVFFIDILAFKNKVKSSGTPKEIKDIIDCLKTDFEKSNERHKLNYQITQISDCIIVSFKNDTSFNVYPMLLIISFVQANALVKHGLLFRGAGVYGSMIHNKDYIFGTAYQKAYELEEENAIYPRVIIEKDLINKIKSQDEKNSCLELLKEDEEYYYIDYLTNEQSSDNDKSMQIEYYLKINEIIKKNLRTSGNILKKYKWLKDRYNETIKIFNEENNVNLKLIK